MSEVKTPDRPTVRLKSDIGPIGGRRLFGVRRIYYGPVLWILVLLAGWFLMTEWQTLPQAIGRTMAAL